MRSPLSRGLACFVAILLAAAIAGCAPPVQVKPLVLPDKGGKTLDRGAATHGHEYAGPKDELTVSSPTVKPTMAAGGSTLFYQMTYTLSSRDRKKEFKVVDVITLSGPGLQIELSRKTYKKSHGSHISSLEFVVPPGLSPGPYTLTSTIRAAGQEMKQQCNFTVGRQKE